MRRKIAMSVASQSTICGMVHMSMPTSMWRIPQSMKTRYVHAPPIQSPSAAPTGRRRQISFERRGRISGRAEGEGRIEPVLAADLPPKIEVFESSMSGFRDHRWERSSPEILDADLLAVQAINRSDVGIADADDCHLPLPSLDLERDRDELDPDHFGDQPRLRVKRAAPLEGEHRAQCLAL